MSKRAYVRTLHPCSPVDGAAAGSIYHKSSLLRPNALACRYLERRSISLSVAETVGLRTTTEFFGRAAILAPLWNPVVGLAGVHLRFIHHRRGQDRMLTVASSPSAFLGYGTPLSGCVLLVEGVFDALALAECQAPAFAVLGEPIPWLLDRIQGRVVFLAFDGSRAGDSLARKYEALLRTSKTTRIRPPGRKKDWSTALVRLGHHRVEAWLTQAGVSRAPLPMPTGPGTW